jgi:hypothetical protein
VSFIIFDEHKQTLLEDFNPFDSRFVNKIDIPEHDYKSSGYAFQHDPKDTVKAIKN